MPIDLAKFEEGRLVSELSAEENVVKEDLSSRGWSVTRARGRGGPFGEPDLRAQREGQTIFIEVKKLQKRSDESYGVTITKAQLPRHSNLAESGTPCYLAFVMTGDVYYYVRTEPP